MACRSSCTSLGTNSVPFSVGTFFSTKRKGYIFVTGGAGMFFQRYRQEGAKMLQYLKRYSVLSLPGNSWSNEAFVIFKVL